jgi:hypothetical protein
MEVPVVFQYQRALDDFRRAGEASPLLKRMSELISLLDLTTTLNSAMSREEILDAALLIVMGELQAGRGCLLVRAGDGAYDVRASRGLPAGAPVRVTMELTTSWPRLVSKCSARSSASMTARVRSLPAGRPRV